MLRVHLCNNHCESKQGFPGASRTGYDEDGNLHIFPYTGEEVMIYTKCCPFCGKKVGSEGFFRE